MQTNTKGILYKVSKSILTAVILAAVFCTLLATPVMAKEKNNRPKCDSIAAETAVVIDVDTGAVLYSKSKDKVMYPASTTKIITAALAIRNLKLDDTITFSSTATDLDLEDATLGFKTGEKISVKDCLYGLMLHSANECANALAEKVAGSNADFAVLMNKFAADAGAVNTNFTNPSGLFDKNHYTSCYDMALMTRLALKSGIYMKVDSTTSYTIGATNKSDEERTFYHRHKMLFPGAEYYYQYAIGGKTGYLDEAGRCLVTIAKKDDISLISVVMKSTTDDVFSDSQTILEYGFNNFKRLKISDYETKFANDGIARITEGGNLKVNSYSMVTVPEGKTFDSLTARIEEDLYNGPVLRYYDGDFFAGESSLVSVDRTDADEYSPLLATVVNQQRAEFKDAFFINVWVILAIAIIIILLIIVMALISRRAVRISYYNGKKDVRKAAYGKRRKPHNRGRNQL